MTNWMSTERNSAFTFNWTATIPTVIGGLIVWTGCLLLMV